MALEIRVPSLGESIVDGVISTWLKHEGDAVQQGEALLELETDKVNLEVTAEQAGSLQQILKKEGETVAVGELLGMLASEQTGKGESPARPDPVTAPAPQETPAQPAASIKEAAPKPLAQPISTPAPEENRSDGTRPPTPLASRLAAEHQVDLSQIKSAEPQGRITRDDVVNYLEKSVPKGGQTEPAPPPLPPSPPPPGRSPRFPAQS